MRPNIHDSTCTFGLGQVDGECSRTLASFDPSGYLQTQLAYMALGLVTVVPTSFLYLRATRNGCAKLQQRSLLLSLYAAITFVARGADPNGYKHVIPRPIILFLSNSCTAALYTIYVMSLVYWASIIQQGAAQLERPIKIRCLQFVSISALWTFYVLLSAWAFLSKGFLSVEVSVLQLAVSAGFLLLVSIVFLVYGLRVHKRLQAFELQQQLRIDQARAQISGLQDGVDRRGLVDKRQEKKCVPAKQPSHSARIRKILFIVEIFSLAVAIVQLAVGVSRSHGPFLELDCANGYRCNLIRCSMNLLHWFQAACVCIVIWVFRNTQKKEKSVVGDDQV